MRSLRRVVTLLVLAVATIALAQNPPDNDTPANPAEEAIEEAITLLEARKATLEAVSDKEKVGIANSGLRRQLQKKADAKPQGLPEITPMMLRKKLHGRSTFNPRTGELTFVYDFKSRTELGDFDLGSAKPEMRSGFLKLEAGESIKHVAKYQTMTATCALAMNNRDGTHFGTTSGVRMWCRGGDLIGLYRKPDRDPFVMKGGVRWPESPQTPVPVELTITGDRVGLNVGEHSIGKAWVGEAGQLVLEPENGRDIFGHLTITGKIDPDWAVEFFGK